MTQIGSNYSINRTTHKLIIQEDETKYAKGSLFLFFLLLTFIIVFIILIILGEITTMNFLIGFLIFIGFEFLAFARYRHYNRIVEWTLDNSFGTAKYQKTSPTAKELKSVLLSDIKSLKSSYVYFSFNYRISFILANNQRILVLAGIREEDRERYENNLSEFLNVPLMHHKSFGTLALQVLSILFLGGIYLITQLDTRFYGILLILFIILSGYIVVKKDL